MPEPQGSAPVVGDKDRTNFTRAGVGTRVSPTRLDQTENKGSAESSGQKVSKISANSTFDKATND